MQPQGLKKFNAKPMHVVAGTVIKTLQKRLKNEMVDISPGVNAASAAFNPTWRDSKWTTKHRVAITSDNVYVKARVFHEKTKEEHTLVKVVVSYGKNDAKVQTVLRSIFGMKGLKVMPSKKDKVLALKTNNVKVLVPKAKGPFTKPKKPAKITKPVTFSKKAAKPSA